MLVKAKKLKECQKKAWRINDDAFLYYYENAEDMLSDFEVWLRSGCGKNEKGPSQVVNNATQIWSSVDDKLCLFLNMLIDPENLDDHFFTEHFEAIKENSKSSKENQTKCLQASTISSKLSSLKHLVVFSKSRCCYFALSFKQMDCLTSKICELNKRLAVYTHNRRQLQQWQSEDLVTQKHCQLYGSSDHVQQLLQTIKDWKEGTTVTKTFAIHLRDYVMFMICMGNAARSSNIMNMTIEEFHKATYN